jgi:uncharacterized membrane protein SirB2
MNAYLVAKTIHVICVALSIGGFVARFALSLGRPEILRQGVVRVAPHLNDTVLLAAAITMLVVAQWNVFEMPWLLAKIVGLLVYVGCGVVALRRGRTLRTRVVAFVAALAVFGYVVSVAFSKSLAGPFARMLS